MTFEETVDAITALCGERAHAKIWSRDEGSHTVASLSGELERIVLQDDLPAEVARNLDGVTAIVFKFGSDPANCLNLWPDRFLCGTRLISPEIIEVITVDAVIRIARRRPWID
jgi:hypothetical protein